jgi:pimeloyl-ACP methyl ester carboxylesterase
MDRAIRPPQGYLVSVLRSKEFSMHEMIALTLRDFPEVDFSMMESVADLFNLDMRVKVTAISYNTVDPKGDPVIASGIIVKPLGMASRGVVHVPPTTPLSSLEGGSDLLIITEGVFAFLGFTVIIPDLIGSGISAGLPQPFLFMDNTGRVCYDMQLASMEYFDRYEKAPLDPEIDIFGYSGGATGAVALLRHIDRLTESPVKVKKLFAGGGVYHMSKTYEILKERGCAEYPLIPLMIKSMDYWYNLQLDYSRIFTGALLANREEWLDGTRNSGQMRELIGPQLDTYMHPDFFSAEGNSEIKKIENALSLHSILEGWNTRTLIYLGHATDDLSVPYEETQAFFNIMNSKSKAVMTKGSGGHYNYGIDFFISGCLFLTVN